MRNETILYAFLIMAHTLFSIDAAWAKGKEKQYYNIAEQPMAQALIGFSRASGIQILFPYDEVEGMRSNAVKGRMTAYAALTKLIENSPLRITLMRDDVAAVAMLRHRDGAGQLAGPNLDESSDPSVKRPVAMAGLSHKSWSQPIVVIGRRLSQSDQAIGKDDTSHTVSVTRNALLSAPAGISGLKMLEYLPGFNVQTDGALGLYEFSNSVQTRAFNLNQIGFVVDGIPVGRSDAFGGSPIFRYVDNENLAVVKASPGAGAVGLPSYSSLGPIVEYSSIEPQDRFGAFAAQTLGQDNLTRSFLRLSSGELGPVKGYLAYTKLDSDLWRGAGDIDREHWEALVYTDLGGDSWAHFKFVANDFFDYDSPFLTREEYRSSTPDAGGKTGRDRGYIGTVPTPGTPGFEITVPGVPYSNDAYDYYFANALNSRDDKLYGATVHLAMTPNAWSEITLYGENKHGFGVSPDSYENSLNYYSQQSAAGLSVTRPRGLQYGLSTVDGERYGLLGRLHFDIGAHSLETGFWGELDQYRRTQTRFNKAGGAPDGAVITTEPVYYRRDYHSRRNTLQLYLKDDISLFDDRMLLSLGVKSLQLDYRYRGYRDFSDYALPNGDIGYGPQQNSARYTDHFLPMIGLLYRFDNRRSQLFASFSENLALPRGMDDIYSVATIPPVPQPKPERARNIEIGVRTDRPHLFASLAIFRSSFDNRIQQVSGILPGSGGRTENFYQNVGKVEAYGAEFSGTFKPAILRRRAYFNANITYNRAKYEGDIVQADIKGNSLPDSPKWILSGGATFEPTPWLVTNISVRYTGSRFGDDRNSTAFKLPAFTVVTAYLDIGYGEGSNSLSLGPLRNVRARINVDNLFDKDVLSFVLPMGTDSALYRPLSPRSIQATVSVEF